MDPIGTDSLFRIADPAGFEALALATFRRQHALNPTYRTYCDLIGMKPERVQKTEDIPCLPIEMFREKAVLTGAPDVVATAPLAIVVEGHVRAHYE